MPGINKWAILDKEWEDTSVSPPKIRKVFDPHEAQLQIMEDPARFKVCPCGRRLGKSNMVGHEFLPYAALARKKASYLKSESQRMEYWIVGPQYDDSEKSFRVFYDKCVKLGIPFDKPGTYYSMGSKQMTVSLWDGAFLLSAKSEAQPNGLVGEALSGVLLDEAAKMKANTWEQLIRPTLSDFGGWATFTSTPEGKNWFHKLYMDAIKPGFEGWSGHRIPAWRNWHVYTQSGRENKSSYRPEEMTIDEHVRRMMALMADNPGYTSFEIIKSQGLQIDDEVADLANTLTIPTFQQEVAADFTDFVGKVFKEFDEETHCKPLPFHTESNWETVAAVDYGYRNPSVWLLIQIGPWGEINVLDELYQSNLAPDEFATEILRRGLLPDSCSAFYPDPASPGDTRILENIFRRAGKRVKAQPHTGGELQNRLNLIRLALKNRITDNDANAPHWQEFPSRPDLKRPQIMFDSTKCPMMAYELGEYRYPKEKGEEVETSNKRWELPMKKDDHTPEALGRFLAGRYHSAAQQWGSGTRISRAKFMQSLSGKSEHPGGYGDTPAGIPQGTRTKRRGPWNS